MKKTYIIACTALTLLAYAGVLQPATSNTGLAKDNRELTKEVSQ
jgi:hypothetical protein